ncbi:MAG TPA: acyl-CoA dehydrogenase family protein [Steroidobacteraceae bacterium]|nr:acyl-CoA dehydrogenase family protein [Steroidobacteraceae bacterium]
MTSNFVQDAPRLANRYTSDWLLRSYLERKLGRELLAVIEPELIELGELAAGGLLELQRADRPSEPRLTQWDAWGARIDRIETTALWHEAERVAVRFGLTAIPYEGKEGAWSRTRQFALVYLFHPVSDVYTCPLAMTDGAARALLDGQNARLISRAVPRLTSREPGQFWTSGQWMTEATGGSDVGLTRTLARAEPGGTWRLHGKKWFTSAATSQMALTLARPEGNPAGGAGLALFYLETRDAEGAFNGIRIERLKEKLGTRKVPTAELTLEGSVAELVAGTSAGTRAIEPMLKITRTWNSVCAAACMRHGLALAEDYANRRRAFGALLSEQPLHRETLAELAAETAGAFLLTFFLIELLGREEAGLLDEEQALLLRFLTPIVKLATGKQAVAVVTETLEAFGGAGYIEDTGMPVLLRDTHVLPIWEGTTNVLSLDALLRADAARGMAALMRRVQHIATSVTGEFKRCADVAGAAVAHAIRWHAAVREQRQLQAGARRLTMTLARAFELALLAEHGGQVGEAQVASVCREACARLRRAGVDWVQDQEEG